MILLGRTWPRRSLGLTWRGALDFVAMSPHSPRLLVSTIAATLTRFSCASPPAPYEPAPEESVKPGINDSFLVEELEIEDLGENWAARFRKR